MPWKAQNHKHLEVSNGLIKYTNQNYKENYLQKLNDNQNIKNNLKTNANFPSSMNVMLHSFAIVYSNMHQKVKVVLDHGNKP